MTFAAPQFLIVPRGDPDAGGIRAVVFDTPGRRGFRAWVIRFSSSG